MLTRTKIDSRVKYKKLIITIIKLFIFEIRLVKNGD
jgi:hypothetical protein